MDAIKCLIAISITICNIPVLYIDTYFLIGRDSASSTSYRSRASSCVDSNSSLPPELIARIQHASYLLHPVDATMDMTHRRGSGSKRQLGVSPMTDSATSLAVPCPRHHHRRASTSSLHPNDSSRRESTSLQPHRRASVAVSQSSRRSSVASQSSRRGSATSSRRGSTTSQTVMLPSQSRRASTSSCYLEVPQQVYSSSNHNNRRPSR